MKYTDEARKAFWDSFNGEINRAVADEKRKADVLREQFGAPVPPPTTRRGILMRSRTA